MVLEVLESNVKRGSQVFEEDHVSFNFRTGHAVLRPGSLGRQRLREGLTS